MSSRIWRLGHDVRLRNWSSQVPDSWERPGPTVEVPSLPSHLKAHLRTERRCHDPISHLRTSICEIPLAGRMPALRVWGAPSALEGWMGRFPGLAPQAIVGMGGWPVKRGGPKPKVQGPNSEVQGFRSLCLRVLVVFPSGFPSKKRGAPRARTVLPALHASHSASRRGRFALERRERP